MFAFVIFCFYTDCIDGTDETDCNNIVTCQTNERLCKSDKKCIPESYWCDQDPDCKHNFFLEKKNFHVHFTKFKKHKKKLQVWTVQMNKIAQRKISHAIIHPGNVTMALLVLTSSKSVTKNLIVKIAAMKDFVVKIFFVRHLTIIVQIIVKILQTVIGVIVRPACT